MRIHLTASALALSLVLPAAIGHADDLAGNDLRQLVTGKRVYLATPFGGEFPLNYRSSGVVTGDGSALGLGKLMAPKESGKWWVKDDQLCQQWPTWYDGKTTCFRISKTGGNSIEWVRDDGKQGRARIEG